MWPASLFLFLQLAQPPVVIQRFGYEITVPHGWTALMVSRDARLEHTTGATLTIRKSKLQEAFETVTYRATEVLANPLGFARIEKPRWFKDSAQEWMEVDIRGNRLTDHRRILYRAIQNRDELTEIIFESPENRFDALAPEALSIAASQKSVGGKVGMRQ
jgi:hypothetical protein